MFDGSQEQTDNYAELIPKEGVSTERILRHYDFGGFTYKYI